MPNLEADMKSLGLAARRTTLYRLGYSKREIQRAVIEGELVALTRLWVAHPTVNPSIASAVRAHGALTHTSALRSYGVWVSEEFDQVHIAVVPGANLPSIAGVRRHWRRHTVDALREWRVTLVDALLHYIPETTRYNAVATLDSALNQRLLTPDDLEVLRASLPRRCLPWLSEVDARAGSGLESIVRLAARDQGWRVEIQVPLGYGRVDLVIDGWLYVEVDGDRWHHDETQARRDRRRNREVLERGGRWIRLEYSDIMHNLDDTIDLLRTMVADGPPMSSGLVR